MRGKEEEGEDKIGEDSQFNKSGEKGMNHVDHSHIHEPPSLK